MANRIEIDPALLMQQSGQMEKIASSLQSLLDGVLGDLKNVSASWSDKLSNNFAGKIGSAQKSFLGSLNMLKISADSTKRAAAALTEFEQRWAQRMGGKLGADQLKKVPISLLIGKTMVEGVENLGILRKGAKLAHDEYEKVVPSSVRGGLKYGKDKLLSEWLGDYKSMPGAIEKLLDGDVKGFVDTVGSGAAGVLMKEAFLENGVAESDAGTYVKYGINVAKDGMSALKRQMDNPSFKNLIDFGWSITGQPVLDTAGSTIETVVKMFPGVSEYYEKNGCEDIGDMSRQALGDFYGALTGNEETREFYKNYYADCDTPVQKLFDVTKETTDFIVDEIKGGRNPVEQFFKTAAKDVSSTVSNLTQVFRSSVKQNGFISALTAPVDSQIEITEEAIEKYFKKS